MDRVAQAAAGYLKENPPQFEVGDTVDVHVRIKEGDKERIQIFNGVVISLKGKGIGRTFIVRRIVQGEGLERVFPIHSPFVVDVKTRKRAKIRRAKLYYLRKRKGKRARMKERLDFHRSKGAKAKKVAPTKPAEEAQEPVTAATN
jgi:large subunit ribosomal protein L19